MLKTKHLHVQLRCPHVIQYMSILQSVFSPHYAYLLHIHFTQYIACQIRYHDTQYELQFSFLSRYSEVADVVKATSRAPLAPALPLPCAYQLSRCLLHLHASRQTVGL